MPNATVATTTRTEPAKNCACVLWRSFGSWPAWYALAFTPLVCKYAATVSAWFWNARTRWPTRRRAWARAAAGASASPRARWRARASRSASGWRGWRRRGTRPPSGMSSVERRDASVRAVAVAVSASTGLRRRSLERKTRPSRWYAGRKLCDHSLTQCASSTTASETPPGTIRRSFRKRSFSRRSGETKSTLSLPARISSSTAKRCVWLWSERSAAPAAREAIPGAGPPSAPAAATRPGSGPETATGSWYVSDFPAPVGRSASVDPPRSTRRITSSWPGPERLVAERAAQDVGPSLVRRVEQRARRTPRRARDRVSRVSREPPARRRRPPRARRRPAAARRVSSAASPLPGLSPPPASPKAFFLSAQSPALHTDCVSPG